MTVTWRSIDPQITLGSAMPPRTTTSRRWRCRGEAPLDSTEHMSRAVTDATFETDVLRSEKPVLVDFWAEWCGPCKMIAPVLEEIGKEQDGKLTIAKLNVDENPDVARRYGVLSIPTLMLFVSGVEKKRVVGFSSKRDLVAELSEFLG